MTPRLPDRPERFDGFLGRKAFFNKVVFET
jgi:hypothetical protein